MIAVQVVIGHDYNFRRRRVQWQVTSDNKLRMAQMILYILFNYPLVNQ